MRKRALVLALLLAAARTAAGLAEMIDLSTPLPQAEATPAPNRAPQLTEAPLEDVPPLRLDCAAAMLVEPESGQIIFAQNPDTPRAVASITKVMTILLAIEAVEQGRMTLEENVPVSANASGMGGSQVLLDTGEMQSVSVLLKSCISFKEIFIASVI